MKQTKTTIFLFSVIDYSAMEQYFEQMAAQGWMLEKIGVIFARFRRIEPAKLRFTVDIFTEPHTNPKSRGLQDYITLCEESGWRYVAGANRFQIFCADAGEAPTPIQTDDSLAEKIIHKTLLGPELLVFLLCLPSLLLNFSLLFKFPYTRLYTNIGMLSAFYFPVFAIPLSFYLVSYLLWLIQAKRNVLRGLPLPKVHLGWARARGITMLVVAVLLISATFVACIWDAMNGKTFILPALLVPLLGAFVGIALQRGKAANSNRLSIKQLIIGAGLVAVLTVAGGFLTIRMAVRPPNEQKQPLPEGYTALTLEDFHIYNHNVSRFSKEGSLLVPLRYEYWEASQQGSIYTESITAATPGIARYIFDSIIKEYEQHAWSTIEYSDSFLWNADDACFLYEPDGSLLLLKDRQVLLLRGSMLSEEPSVRETVRKVLGL